MPAGARQLWVVALAEQDRGARAILIDMLWELPLARHGSRGGQRSVQLGLERVWPAWCWKVRCAGCCKLDVVRSVLHVACTVALERGEPVAAGRGWWFRTLRAVARVVHQVGGLPERVHRQHSLCPHGLALPIAPRLAFECVYACVVCSTEPRFCKPTEIGFFVAKTVRQVAGGYASCTC